MTQSTDAYQTLCEIYDAQVQMGILKHDSVQRRTMAELEELRCALENKQFKRRWWQFGRSKNAHLHQGAYIWGDVGRGKSMIMDLFYEHVNVPKKKRIHFHAFMQDIHARIHAWRQLKPKGDLLAMVVKEMARDVKLLCFDELQVHDVTDASILSRLFEQLLDAGVVIISTSNRAPCDLYQGGIQRDQFLPFIALIEAKLLIIKLKAKTDYRLEQIKSLNRTYFSPLGAEADDFIYDSYCALTLNHASEAVTLNVKGRRLEIEKNACGVAWLTFAECCERPLGAVDYLEIAARFHTMILQNIPALNREMRNEAKRFVTLIDTLYEHNVTLICSAEVPPEELYPSGDGSFEFERTVSRLLEMQSERYISAEHITE